MSFRSISCGFVNEDHIDQEIEVAGWIHRRRDHGGVIFFDLRDSSGLLQVVYNPEDNEAFSIAEGCRNEFVIRAKGIVRKRPEGTVNKGLPTGMVELNSSVFVFVVMADLIEGLPHQVTVLIRNIKHISLLSLKPLLILVGGFVLLIRH